MGFNPRPTEEFFEDVARAGSLGKKDERVILDLLRFNAMRALETDLAGRRANLR
jgi:hypothetical protein